MKIVKKIGLWVLAIAVFFYLSICTLMYFNQEKLIFHPTKLPSDFKFNYKQSFAELTIKEEDGVKLSGLLFRADSSKGLIFYLHGNAGALNTWGNAAKNYTKLGYDMFILDYRGFGKSEGEISSEKQFFSDVQQAYNELKKTYPENKIIIVGYSIGTGPAAMLASTNQPKLLILQAPYYSLLDMMQHTYSFVPEFLLKYKFQTNEFLKNTKSQVYIFHGDADEVIYYGSSIKLKESFKPGDKLVTLPGKGHNKMNDDPIYLSDLKSILTSK